MWPSLAAIWRRVTPILYFIIYDMSSTSTILSLCIISGTSFTSTSPSLCIISGTSSTSTIPS